MDKDRIKGKIEDISGGVKRRVGEWTGDEKTQAEGLAEQVKGKTRNTVGKMKDAARDAVDKIHDKKIEHEKQTEEAEQIERERRDKEVA